MSTTETKECISPGTPDFALRTLIYLAAMPEEELVQVRQISQLFDLSSNHLSKVVNELANLGFLESRRGRGGGIRLGKPAGEINVGEVVRAMEPSLTPINCHEPKCILLPHCRFKSILAEASDAFINTIDKYTLDDLIEGKVQALRGL